MTSCSITIHKLQTALNMHGQRVLYSTTQFFSEDQNRPVTIYHIKMVNKTEGKRTSAVEVFSSASQIRVVQFLAEVWDMVQKEGKISNVEEIAKKHS